ncbi:unnamed protein product [Candidula unifasciata]|uniref:Uncharacterized protein n=1 Tax=Candidula unifasciata TaxID=100452 RepID=A0A8S3ZGI8_9EUPU|nr:unnamed protein product [Candidula unifasciata]
MALMRRCCCWELRTATFSNLITITILAGGALLLRLLDFGAILSPDFEINQSFKTPWKSHQWQAFLASDIILIICHVIIIIFSVYMLYLVTHKHFVLYVETLRTYSYIFILYIFAEFCFSIFEFSFYGLNTFRLAFIVFLWLYWLARTVGNIGMAIIFFSRIQEIEDDLALEIRSIDRKYVHSYVNF